MTRGSTIDSTTSHIPHKDSIFMHSMRLLAAKDVQNEELFYDYRLSSGSDESHPKWYSIINKEELDNRWHHKD